MIAPKTLSQYPWVVVRLSCKLCTRRGQYRLARLAARFGPEMDLDRLLAHLAHDCPHWRSNPRKYAVRCGARFIDLDHNLPPVDDPVVRQRAPSRESLPQRQGPERMTMLSQWTAPDIALVCDVCGKRDKYDTAAIRAATPGNEAALADLLKSQACGCPNRRVKYLEDRCGARLVPE